MALHIGQLITAPFLPAPAEVKKFEPRRGYYRLEMLLKDGSNQFLAQNITDSQLAQIKIVERNPVALTGLATRHIDYSGLLKEKLTAEENRLVPEYVADYFLRAFRRLGGQIEARGDTYHLASVPFDLRRWGDDYDFKAAYGRVFRESGG